MIAEREQALAGRFEPYLAHGPKWPAWYVTPPDLTGCIHRFYDTSPLSPSGRYLALTRLPSEDRPPLPGERADIVVVDLQRAQWKVVAQTMAFDTQLGAQLQWGAGDGELFFNDMEPRAWRPFCVRLDPRDGRRIRFEHPVYMVSPDGRRFAAPCLLRMPLTQPGYGVVAPLHRIPPSLPADPEDGLWVTSVDSGSGELVLSLARIADEIAEIRNDLQQFSGVLHGFHVKWNPQGDRIMFVVRMRCGGKVAGRRRNYIVTVRPDGADPALALSARIWQRGGHHPDWCPDGRTIVQNLNPYGDGLRFCTFDHRGGNLRCLSKTWPGGGHPTVHSGGRFLLTDAYQDEPVAYGDGTVPIRLIDLREQTEERLLRIETAPRVSGWSNELRVDPHPAWDRSGLRFVINCTDQGRRRVVLVDLTQRLESAC